MRVKLAAVVGGTVAVAILVVALWVWQNALPLAERLRLRQLQVGVWSLRCATVALAALAQVLLVRCVLDAVYRRDMLSDLLRLSAVLLCLMAAASAISLALVGR